jgi:malate dehydrogenase (oxaloacetate-decarboxylating)(NADP+)
VLRNWPYRDARIIVVTDGERILGLGDLGASGMGIPIGKLALYTACAGVHPRRCLPVMFDVGTNNESLLEDPLYLGPAPAAPRRNRIRRTGGGVSRGHAGCLSPASWCSSKTLRTTTPSVCCRRMVIGIPCFNDDIQGTAAVTASGIPVRAAGDSSARLRDQTFLFLGAGEAATGIADLLTTALMDGRHEAGSGAARSPGWSTPGDWWCAAAIALAEHKRPYAHEHPPVVRLPRRGRDRCVQRRSSASVRCANAFTREVIETMARLNERPIVFALSNPTSRAECTAEQAYAWSDGRALFASGSPFDPLNVDGRRFVPRQGNNSYIFPGVGLGAVAVQASRVTDGMFMVAARALAETVRDEDLAQGSLFPALARVREVSARIAAAVAEVAFAEGLAGIERPADLGAWVETQMYHPEYVSYVA